MAKKRFDHPNGDIKDMQGYNGVDLPSGVRPDDAAEELYSRVGERFRVRWEPRATTRLSTQTTSQTA